MKTGKWSLPMLSAATRHDSGISGEWAVTSMALKVLGSRPEESRGTVVGHNKVVFRKLICQHPAPCVFSGVTPQIMMSVLVPTDQE